ncbi:hypothetical protein BJ742DRAFT_772923 [Cladochytrium replicatum]|nr:hypothetical protein BJ742DRAFT_772923 [Cladochytrium replicatum]
MPSNHSTGIVGAPIPLPKVTLRVPTFRDYFDDSDPENPSISELTRRAYIKNPEYVEDPKLYFEYGARRGGIALVVTLPIDGKDVGVGYMMGYPWRHDWKLSSMVDNCPELDHPNLSLALQTLEQYMKSPPRRRPEPGPEYPQLIFYMHERFIDPGSSGIGSLHTSGPLSLKRANEVYGLDPNRPPLFGRVWGISVNDVQIRAAKREHGVSIVNPANLDEDADLISELQVGSDEWWS